VVKEGCSQQDKVLLILAIVALGVLGVAALYFAISEIIRLFF
jgi:disulfide bond formation protein DsbB